MIKNVIVDLEEVLGEPALSEEIPLNKLEQRLAGQLLSLVALRMCYNATSSSDNDWEHYHIRSLVAAKCTKCGKDIQKLSERQFNKMARELAPRAQYDEQEHRKGAVGAFIDDECITAYERAAATLVYWKVARSLGYHIYEMTIHAKDLFEGNCDLLQQGNRNGLAQALSSFFKIHIQNSWGPRPGVKKEFEIVVPEEVVHGFEKIGLTEKKPEGLVWANKMEPYFDAGGGPGCEAGEFFDEACGKKIS